MQKTAVILGLALSTLVGALLLAPRVNAPYLPKPTPPPPLTAASPVGPIGDPIEEDDAPTGSAREDESSADEASYLKRHGIDRACSTVGAARKLEGAISLPVTRLSGGSQKVELRYLETGWPLGLPGMDADRPVELAPWPEGPVRDLPAAMGSVRRYGTLALGPRTPDANRFPLVLDGDPHDWSQARLCVAKRGGGDFAGAACLRNMASDPSKMFATVVVVPLTFASEGGARRQPMVLWMYADGEGQILRYYSISHWRATIELPYSQKRVFAVLYDHRGAGDLSSGVLALIDARYSPVELFNGDDGEERWRQPEDGQEWRTRNFLAPGQAVRTTKEEVRLRSIAPMGDAVVLEIEPRRTRGSGAGDQSP